MENKKDKRTFIQACLNSEKKFADFVSDEDPQNLEGKGKKFGVKTFGIIFHR